MHEVATREPARATRARARAVKIERVAAVKAQVRTLFVGDSAPKKQSADVDVCTPLLLMLVPQAVAMDHDQQ